MTISDCARILVFSDSHGDVDSMYLPAEDELPDMIIHLGDHFGDAELLGHMLPDIPMLAVPGNCDFTGGDMREMIKTELCGKRLILTHGHDFGVKDGLQRLFHYGQANFADIVLFGHTHEPFYELRDGILLANPGRAGRNVRRGLVPSYGVLTLDGDGAAWDTVILD